MATQGTTAYPYTFPVLVRMGGLATHQYIGAPAIPCPPCICPDPPPSPPSPGPILAPPSTPQQRTPKIDQNTGDLVVSGGQLIFVYETQYIRQLLQSRLGLFEGEYIADSQEGMPWYQTILGKGFLPNVVRGAFIQRILGTPGISSIRVLTLTFDGANRTLRVYLEAQTDLGLLTDNFLLPVAGN